MALNPPQTWLPLLSSSTMNEHNNCNTTQLNQYHPSTNSNNKPQTDHHHCLPWLFEETVVIPSWHPPSPSKAAHLVATTTQAIWHLLHALYPTSRPLTTWQQWIPTSLTPSSSIHFHRPHHQSTPLAVWEEEPFDATVIHRACSGCPILIRTSSIILGWHGGIFAWSLLIVVVFLYTEGVGGRMV